MPDTDVRAAIAALSIETADIARLARAVEDGLNSGASGSAINTLAAEIAAANARNAVTLADLASAFPAPAPAAAADPAAPSA